MAIESFVWKVWGRKIIKRFVQVLVAGVLGWAVKSGSFETLQGTGIAIDPSALQAFLTGVIYAGIEALRNYGKIKLRLNWL